jgi:hypothetical protein
MDIHRENGFRVWDDLEGRLLLGIETKRLRACLDEFRRREAYGLFGNPSFGFKQDNLDFLIEVPEVRSIWFWDIELKNVDGLYSLPDLKSFGAHPKRPGVDFSRLPTLDDVFVHYNPADQGLASLKRLRTLGVWHYNPKHASFEGLEMATGIAELSLVWGNAASLAGLPRFPRLTKLRIERYPKLKTLADLPRIAPNLEHLVVTGCSRVSDGRETARHLPKLHHAWIGKEGVVTDGVRKSP